MWNLYVYCENSPLTSIDPDGNVTFHGVRIPFFAFFHDKIKNDIVDMNEGLIAEYKPFRGFRTDLYNVHTSEMYEIKPDYEFYYSGEDAIRRILSGVIQLTAYMIMGNYFEKGNHDYKPGTTPLKLPQYEPFHFLGCSVYLNVRQDVCMIFYSVDVEITDAILYAIVGYPVFSKDTPFGHKENESKPVINASTGGTALAIAFGIACLADGMFAER